MTSMVTSRSRLRIYGEQEFPVAPLAPNSAVELFVQRAAAVWPDFAITSLVAKEMGVILEGTAPSVVFEIMASEEDSAFERLNYARLAEVHEQGPIGGRADLYYGGTTYENTKGLGMQLFSAAQRGEKVSLPRVRKPEALRPKEKQLLAVPITRLYDRGGTIVQSKLLAQRIEVLAGPRADQRSQRNFAAVVALAPAAAAAWRPGWRRLAGLAVASLTAIAATLVSAGSLPLVGIQVVTPLRTDDGRIVLFDRGWVPQEQKDTAKRAQGQLAGHVEHVEGLSDL